MISITAVGGQSPAGPGNWSNLVSYQLSKSSSSSQISPYIIGKNSNIVYTFTDHELK
jgi:hypothetical protein